MKFTWWQALCVFLLIYVIAFTFIVPLGPGLIAVDNTSVEQEVNERTLVGYNSHFSDPSTQVFLSPSKGQYLPVSIIEVISEAKVKIKFEIPKTLASKNLNVLVNNNIDGTLFLQGAFYCNSCEVDLDHTLSALELKVEAQKASGLFIPFQPNLNETIRNLMLHVPMWFTMFFLTGMGLVQAVKYLLKENLRYDLQSSASVHVGLLFCTLGLITGSIWARFTWGAWWVNDPQLNGAMVTFLVYLGYMILRMSVDDDHKKARLSAVYNMFAFVILVVLLMILPRFTESLHPGKDGNPGFNQYDLNSTLRMVFYPAVIAWIILSFWIYRIRFGILKLQRKLWYNEEV
ncbi:MAG: cytochrome c biogenesis protein [Flavobacteriales bacterium]